MQSKPLRWDESLAATCRRPQGPLLVVRAKPPRWQGGKLTDPLSYYKEHYDGLTRGQLQRAHAYVYHRLRQAKLLHHVPTVRRALRPRAPVRKIADPLEYYLEHYDGLTRGALATRDGALYTRLRRAGLLDVLPRGRGGRPRNRVRGGIW